MESIIKTLVEIIELNKDNLTLYPQHIREIEKYLEGGSDKYDSDYDESEFEDFEINILIVAFGYYLSSSEPKQIEYNINKLFSQIPQIKELYENKVKYNYAGYDGIGSSSLKIYIRGSKKKDYLIKQHIEDIINGYLPSSGETKIKIDIGEGFKDIFNDEISKFTFDMIDDLL
jgi:hypothetical protein